VMGAAAATAAAGIFELQGLEGAHQEVLLVLELLVILRLAGKHTGGGGGWTVAMEGEGEGERGRGRGGGGKRARERERGVHDYNSAGCCPLFLELWPPP